MLANAHIILYHKFVITNTALSRERRDDVSAAVEGIQTVSDVLESLKAVLAQQQADIETSVGQTKECTGRA